MRLSRVFIGFAILCCAAAIASPIAAAAASSERASIIPVISAYPGQAVNSSNGFSLYANGINDYWSTTSNGTISFVVYVFPGEEVTQDVTFSVMAPGSDKPVYTYTFKAQNINVGGTWYSIAATGDYSKVGTYWAVVTAGGSEIGRIPVVLAPPSH